MHRLASVAGVLLVAVAAARPLAAQTDPLSIFVGPLRQWTFSQCQTGSIPNADRTGDTTGQQFCVDGLLTLGTQPPERSFNDPANPAATVTYVSWIAQINTTAAPGVFLLNLDLDAEPVLEFTVGRGSQRFVDHTGIAYNVDETLRFLRAGCIGVGCSASAASLDAFTPTSLRLTYEYYLDAPCRHPAVGCPPIFEPPQTGTTIRNFQAVVVTPEPSTYALLGTGLLTLGGIAARRRRGAEA